MARHVQHHAVRLSLELWELSRGRDWISTEFSYQKLCNSGCNLCPIQSPVLRKMANSITRHGHGSCRRFCRIDLGNTKFLSRGLWSIQAPKLPDLSHLSNLTSRQGIWPRYRLIVWQYSLDRHWSKAHDAIHCSRAREISLQICRVHRYILPLDFLLLLCKALQMPQSSTETNEKAWRRVWATYEGSGHRLSSLQSQDQSAFGQIDSQKALARFS